MRTGDTGGTSGAWRLARLLDGYITTQLLFVAASLGIAELLADGPLSASEIAATVDADPGMLTLALRGLAAEDVLAETDDGRFALTATGEGLRRLTGAALVRGELYYRSFPSAPATARQRSAWTSTCWCSSVHESARRRSSGLLERSGFRLERLVPTESPAGLA